MTKKWSGKVQFKHKVKDYAKQIGIEINSLTIRPMANKWASCSTDGNLNFNQELLTIEKKLGEYVIVHELLHFKAPNHGKLWKSLMKAYLGEYEKLDKELKYHCR